MRRCFFCSGGADSVEDAWPHWLTDQFHSTHPLPHQAERHGVQLTPWRVHQPKLTVRCVCRQCNNGWMSRLEVQTRHILQPMVAGTHCVLDMAGQATIALWGLKTAMVLEGIDPPEKRGYTQDERQRLHTLSAIPIRTSVWLAAAVDPTTTHFMSTKARHVSPEDARSITGFSITMAFASVVLQVLTIRVPDDVGPATRVTTNVRPGPWHEATVRIWPTQSPTVVWPPPMGLNGESGLDSIAERFNTSMLDENDLQELAV